MAPVRRAREAFPSSERCRYAERGQRCRRIATVNGELCRHHAIRLRLELEHDNPLDEVIAAVDRRIAQNPDPFIGAVTGMLGRIFGRMQPQQIPPPQAPPRARARPQQQRPAPPQAPPAPNPLLVARELMGFEPTEPLTIDKVQTRKKALARVFHPDMQGGSEARMKKLNQAADLLLSKL